MSNKSGTGHFGFGVVGGAPDFDLVKNRVVHGFLAYAPTTASTQATGAAGASAYRVNISHGVALVDGLALETAVQADYALATANGELIEGTSKVFSLVIYRSLGDNVPRLVLYKGAAATTGAQVSQTDTEIAAHFAAGTVWYKIADITVNRTGDTTVTQTQNNLVGPLLRPE